MHVLNFKEGRYQYTGDDSGMKGFGRRTSELSNAALRITQVVNSIDKEN